MSRVVCGGEAPGRTTLPAGSLPGAEADGAGAAARLPGVAARARQTRSFLVMDMLERAQELARAGRDVIGLTVGEPDFAAPDCVVQACQEALARGETRYTHSLGRLELREAICEHYLRRYGVQVTPDRIVVTPGTSPALLLAAAALCEPGDEVVLGNPYYACYPNFIRFVDAVPREVPTQEEDGFQLTADGIARLLGPRTRAILLNSPANPTGCVIPRDELAAICALGPTVVSDEIYHGLVYEGEEVSALQFSDEAFVLDGFSKRYAMTGFRLGWLVAPRRFVPALQRIQQSLFISANDFVQAAGLAALRHAAADVERMRRVFAARRSFVLSRLAELGIASRARPTGAFYALADVRAYTSDSLGFCRALLEQAGVAVSPGIDFGSNLEGFLRISYACSQAHLEEGLHRLGAYLKETNETV